MAPWAHLVVSGLRPGMARRICGQRGEARLKDIWILQRQQAIWPPPIEDNELLAELSFRDVILDVNIVL